MGAMPSSSSVIIFLYQRHVTVQAIFQERMLLMWQCPCRNPAGIRTKWCRSAPRRFRRLLAWPIQFFTHRSDHTEEAAVTGETNESSLIKNAHGGAMKIQHSRTGRTLLSCEILRVTKHWVTRSCTFCRRSISLWSMRFVHGRCTSCACTGTNGRGPH